MDLFINRILDVSQSNDYQTDDHFLLPFPSWFIVVGPNSKDKFETLYESWLKTFKNQSATQAK